MMHSYTDLMLEAVSRGCSRRQGDQLGTGNSNAQIRLKAEAVREQRMARLERR